MEGAHPEGRENKYEYFRFLKINGSWFGNLFLKRFLFCLYFNRYM